MTAQGGQALGNGIPNPGLLPRAGDQRRSSLQILMHVSHPLFTRQAGRTDGAVDLGVRRDGDRHTDGRLQGPDDADIPATPPVIMTGAVSPIRLAIAETREAIAS